MKITITEPGWAGYTGYFGMVEFADGVSVQDVSQADAAQLAALVAIEEVDTGKNPSDAQRIIDTASMQAVVETTPAETEVAFILEYTKEALEAIADASGIKGIREVADKFGLKGNSITELIARIVSAQAESKQGEPAAPEAPQAAE